jgi:hypothetical protein
MAARATPWAIIAKRAKIRQLASKASQLVSTLLPCHVSVHATQYACVLWQVYHEPPWLRELNATESAPPAARAQYMRQVNQPTTQNRTSSDYS